MPLGSIQINLNKTTLLQNTMSLLPRTTIEQWMILKLIVEMKGFTNVAKKLHRSQSSISYAINQLEKQLRLKLIKSDGRKVELTREGEVLLSNVNESLAAILSVEAHADLLIAGFETRVRLAVDSIFPKKILFSVLAQISVEFPGTRIELTEAMRLSTAHVVAMADIGIAMQVVGDHPGEKLLDVGLVAVAHANHPIFRENRISVERSELKRYLQVRLIESPVTNATSSKFECLAVNSMEAAIEAVRSGLCYGWLPRPVIAELLESGEFRQLPVDIGKTRLIPMVLVLADQKRAGPVTRAIANKLVEMSRDAGSSVGR